MTTPKCRCSLALSRIPEVKMNPVSFQCFHTILPFLLLLNYNYRVKADNKMVSNLLEIPLKPCCKFQDSFSEGYCNEKGIRRMFPKSYEFDGIYYIFESSQQLFCKDGLYNRTAINQVSLFDVHLDGSLEIDQLVYNRGHFCVDEIKPLDNGKSLHLSIATCTKTCSPANPCLKKCCTWEQPSTLQPSFGCQESDPRLGQASFFNLKELEGIYKDRAHSANHLNRMDFMTNYQPGCDTPLRLQSNVQILETGKVEILWGHHTWIELDDYCLESPVKMGAFAKNPKRPEDTGYVVLYCSSQLLKQIGEFTKIQMIYCTISWTFILLTLTVYLLLWKKHSIHGWTQFAFIFSAFLYFFMRFIRRSLELANEFNFSTITVDRIDTFFTLGMLANLVNLSFHMFWTFYKIQPEQVIREWRDLKRLYLSLSVCWIFAVGVILIEFVLRDFNTTITFQATVLALLLGLNAGFVFATAVTIWKQMKQREVLSKAGMDQRKMIVLFVKLFCITGMIWSLKILEQFVKTDNYTRGWFWDTVQFVTYTYGVVIFVVFVLNDRMINGLKEEFPKLKNVLMKQKRQGYEDVTDPPGTSMTPVLPTSSSSSDALLSSAK